MSVTLGDMAKVVLPLVTDEVHRGVLVRQSMRVSHDFGSGLVIRGGIGL